MSQQEKNFEEMMNRIEDILSGLGDGSVSLDRSLELYTEGIALSKQCLERIEAAQQVVEQHSVKEG